MDRVSRLYCKGDQEICTHLALRWKGRVRYTVPRELAAQETCWRVFKPGKLEFALRAMGRWPHLFGMADCAESEKLASIRAAIGNCSGLSCCRTGSEGVWSKDTILFLDLKTVEPLCIAKVGAGEAVDALLANEANWLRALRDQPSLAGQIPELIAHVSGKDFCFVAQSAVAGSFDCRLGELHFEFLRTLQENSLRSMHYRDSQLYFNLTSRMNALHGKLTEAWSSRLATAMQRIDESLSTSPISMVDAHNDFTPWNIRLGRNRAVVFDWEYAAHEQLPLFDPLHFVLMPAALKRESAEKLLQKMQEALQLSSKLLGDELCRKAPAQGLAYLVNVCTNYLWGVGGETDLHPVFDSFARLIDQICDN